MVGAAIKNLIKTNVNENYSNMPGFESPTYESYSGLPESRIQSSDFGNKMNENYDNYHQVIHNSNEKYDNKKHSKFYQNVYNKS